MTNSHLDPVVQWSHLLARLDPVRFRATADALRHSADSGLPASEEEVRLLIAYSLGEISSRDYARGILSHLGLDRTASPVADPPPEAVPVERSEAAEPVEPVVSRQIRREDAVHAYVTGQIPVGEFLRIARG